MNTKRFSYCSLQNQKGFSLIEVLVSLAIFTIVVTISVGSLLVLIDANAKSRSLQLVMSNLNFVLDSMTRDIRTGYNYYCDNAPETSNNAGVSDCPSGADAFSFVEGGSSLTTGLSSNRIAFRRTTVGGRGVIQRQLAEEGWNDVSSADVDITEFRFVVTGTTRRDTVPPTVTIYIEGVVRAGEEVGSEFAIQTTVTQLLLDL